MSYKKGESGNPKGRPKGAKNKISTKQRDYLREFVLDNMGKFETEMKELRGRPFLQIYLSLLQHILPRPASVKFKEVPLLEEYVAMTVEERRNTVNEIQDALLEEEAVEMRKEVIEENKRKRYGI